MVISHLAGLYRLRKNPSPAGAEELSPGREPWGNTAPNTQVSPAGATESLRVRCLPGLDFGR